MMSEVKGDRDIHDHILLVNMTCHSIRIKMEL